MDEKHKRYEHHPVYKRIRASGPKRILALDGGGIRGALTLGYLEKIEQLLRDRYDRQDLVLADYFDLIGGTSTGSIIATMIALGEEIREIKSVYFTLGKKIFTKRKHIFNWWYFKYFLHAEYDHKPLEEELELYLSNLTLGSKDLHTGLAIFAKRADTFSTWCFHNNPLNAYYEENKGILLKDLVRASCAAPTYFKPHTIKLEGGEKAVFIDGGVSMVNNPSLQLFKMAAVSGYHYDWKLGEDNLQIISIGTGHGKDRVQGKAFEKLLTKRSISWAPELPDMFMIDATEQNQFFLQYFSNPQRPEVIDSEVKDLKEDLISEKPLLDYCRYNINLDTNHLNALEIHMSEEEIKSLRKMDIGKNAQTLFTIGNKAAEKQVNSDHFRDVFDFRLSEDKDTILDQKEAFALFHPVIEQKGKRYKKYKNIIAKKLIEETKVTSITSDGIETTNVGKPGDYLVENQTQSKEKYVVSREKFPSLYKLGRDLNEGWSEYTPKGEVDAIELTATLMNELGLPIHFHIIADWGEDQYVRAGDYIVAPVGKNEVYRIGVREYEETYDLMH